MPDFPPDKRPDYEAPDDAQGMDAISGDDPFIMMGDGARLAVLARAACSTGRCRRTTSRSSRRSTTCSTRRSARTRSRITWDRDGEPARPAARRALPGRRLDLPAHRAPHRRADEPQPAVAGRAAAGDVRRDRPGARRRARDRGRRLDDGRDRARRDRGAREGHATACGRCGSTDGPSTRSRLPWHWGTLHDLRRRASPATPPTTSFALSGDPNVSIEDKTFPARCAPGGATRRRRSASPACATGHATPPTTTRPSSPTPPAQSAERRHEPPPES